jgi:uncharacterized membrane protein YjjB (DUF3815 family)
MLNTLAAVPITAPSIRVALTLSGFLLATTQMQAIKNTTEGPATTSSIRTSLMASNILASVSSTGTTTSPTAVSEIIPLIRGTLTTTCPPVGGIFAEKEVQNL